MTIGKIITIDGPSGVGKGSLALALCEHFNFDLLDSGALYRLVALDMLNSHTAISDKQSIAKLAFDLPVVFTKIQHVLKIFLKNKDVTELIRTEEIAGIASKIATIPIVRDALLKKQRNFVTKKGLVADGRDLGSVVFPNADFKLFLTANVKERAKRRVKQLQNTGVNANMKNIEREIALRDDRDQNRKCSPLVPALDAVLLDTSDLNFDQVLNKTLTLINEQGLFSKV